MRSTRRNSRQTILVVDDERAVCEMLVDGLTAGGYRVECAYTGEEAVARVKGRMPLDLVLVDFKLPGSVDGRDVAADLAARELPVIMMSGVVDPTDLSRPAIRKPFRLEEVLALVAETIGPAKSA